MDLSDNITILRQDILALYDQRKKELQHDKIGALEKKIAEKLKFWQELTTKIKKENTIAI